MIYEVKLLKLGEQDVIEDTLQELQLNQMEALLSQSFAGTHILFENQKIAQILQTPTEEMDFFSCENMNQIQELFTSLLKLDSVSKKQSFLQTLPQHEYEILVRTYFHILDNSIKIANLHKH